MSKFNETSSSSESDDQTEAFKEAADTQFFNESMFQRLNEKEDAILAEPTLLPKSLRRSLESTEQSNDFGVSQHFKDFVAKQLSKTLDRSVKEARHEFSSTTEVKQKDENISLGIKLLTSSTVNLTDIAIEKQHETESKQGRRNKKESCNNAVENMSLIKEAAVEPTWILSKESIKGWSDKTKGVAYKYKKLSNGVLVEIN